MAKRKLPAYGKIMKKCSDKTKPTDWKKMGYSGFHACLKGEYKKKR